jgi:[ribosomal protein S5]-alanine N-acetyltransferase
MEPFAENRNLPPEFELDGAKLRALRAADAPALYAYLKNPVVTERTSYPDASLSLAETIIEKAKRRWATGELSKWGLARREDDQIIGTCGYNNWSKSDRWAEIAFDLAPEYWGRGLMRRAVIAILHWSFQHDHIDQVLAYVRVDNERSQRFLQRNGFLRESCLKDFRVCKGIPHDFYVYRLLQSDWTPDK